MMRAAELEISKLTAEWWRKRSLDEGHLNSRCDHHSARVGGTTREMILLNTIEDPFKPAIFIKRELDLDFMPQTINQILRSEGLRAHHAANKPKMIVDQR